MNTYERQGRRPEQEQFSARMAGVCAGAIVFLVLCALLYRATVPQ
jgi:hypothetical protein